MHGLRALVRERGGDGVAQPRRDLVAAFAGVLVEPMRVERALPVAQAARGFVQRGEAVGRVVVGQAVERVDGFFPEEFGVGARDLRRRRGRRGIRRRGGLGQLAGEVQLRGLLRAFEDVAQRVAATLDVRAAARAAIDDAAQRSAERCGGIVGMQLAVVEPDEPVVHLDRPGIELAGGGRGAVVGTPVLGAGRRGLLLRDPQRGIAGLATCLVGQAADEGKLGGLIRAVEDVAQFIAAAAAGEVGALAGGAVGDRVHRRHDGLRIRGARALFTVGEEDLAVPDLHAVGVHFELHVRAVCVALPVGGRDGGRHDGQGHAADEMPGVQLNRHR